MRISAKCRYGLAAMVFIAKNTNPNECITIISISEKLEISKIYLEQVFSLLKRSGLVNSIKGSQGGYQLATSPDKITVGEIMRAIELNMFEKTERAVADSSIAIDKSMETLIWDRLNTSITSVIDSVTLQELVNEADKNDDGNLMFYI
ncbi:MAG: rrf2 family protein putative transcriptional regulator [Clostridiales bacterium]|nr:rrf2 family protein putative transcriptional regulator [Clostridiales bacterium]